MKRVVASLALVLGGMGLFASVWASAAAPTSRVDFPAKRKTITVIVPWDAGGSADIVIRLLAPHLEKELGIPIQVVNRPGGGSQVGLTEFTRSKPDGYTLGAANVPSSNVTYLDPKRKAPYGRKGFQPLANLAMDTGTLVVKPDSKYKTLKDLVDGAKANPGKIKVSTAGQLGNTHLDLVNFQKAAGVQFGAVHFTGGPSALTAVMGGHVDAGCLSIGNYLAQYKSGEVRILGIMSDRESELLPGVKTMEAQGYKVYGRSTRSISAPGGTPKEVVGILSAAIKKAAEAGEFKKKIRDVGLEYRYMGPEEYARVWDEVDAQVTPMIEEIGRKP